MRARNSTKTVGGWRSCLIAVVSTLAASTPVSAHPQPTHQGADIGVAIAAFWGSCCRWLLGRFLIHSGEDRSDPASESIPLRRSIAHPVGS